MSTLQIATPAHRTTAARPAPAAPATAAGPAAPAPDRTTTAPARSAGAAGTTRAARHVPPARPPLRLTRRGRVVVTLLMLALVMVAATFFGGRSAASGESGTPVRTRTVVVDQGDTMWGIAAQVAHGRDIREVIHDIEELNALPGPELVEGQRIAVPVG